MCFFKVIDRQRIRIFGIVLFTRRGNLALVGIGKHSALPLDESIGIKVSGKI